MVKIKINRINFICFFISFLIINSQNNNDTLVLNFYLEESKVYSIEESDNNFKIVVYQVIMCDHAPCPFPIINEKKIENKEECQILKTLFDSYFQNDNIKKIAVYYEQLPEEEVDMILMILEKNQLISILNYEILNNSENYNNKYKRRGFSSEIEKTTKSVIYTIAMGEKQTGGYSIEIKKIKIKGNNVSIYVTEKVPGEDEIVTEALTYPIVQIKFNQFPSSIEVRNYETGEIFQILFV